MAAPYWTDGRITLYLGDCRTVTEWLAADVLVTDPPYGRDWSVHARGKDGQGATKGIAGDQDSATRLDALAAWGDRPALMFGDLLLAPPSMTKQVLIYAKAPNAGLHGAKFGWRRDAEAIYVIGKWPLAPIGHSSILRSGVGSAVAMTARYEHSHAKPVDVMETLIAACPPGTIADPFADSGSTLVAARNLGRKAVGVEIDERYAEAAARRLAQDVLALDMPALPLAANP